MDALPAYAPREADVAIAAPHKPPSRPQVTHTYRLTGGKGTSWARLNVFSKARAPESLPFVLEGEAVTGTVELDLADETPIKAVTISIIGELIGALTERYIFAEASTVLWAGSSKGKLKGIFRWPFSLGLPSTVRLADGSSGVMRTYHLPCSFSARFSSVTVQYRLCAVISRGSFFKSEHTVGTNVSYMAKTQPAPPSIARQLAYQERAPLIGPGGDPTGWSTLGGVFFRGTAFNNRPVHVCYTLSLAKPLSYTRGSVIPLHLTIACPDTQVLDLLSSRHAPVVRLLCTVHCGYRGLVNSIATPLGETKTYLANAKRAAPNPVQTRAEPVQTAMWWVPEACDRTRSTRRELQGELHLPQTMQATAYFGAYSCTYEVAMYLPEVAGFVPNESGKLQSVPVEVFTMYATGPRPVVYSSPEQNVTPNEEPGTRYNPITGISPHAGQPSCLRYAGGF